MVAEAYAHASVLSHYQRLISGNAGYEKVIRTIQYFCHFLAWYLDYAGFPHEAIDFHVAIKKNCGGVRKALRLTKFIDHFQHAAIASNVKTSKRVKRSLVVGRQLGYAFYMLLDNMTYLDSNGIKQFAAVSTVLEMAHYAWLFALVCSVLASLNAFQDGPPVANKDKDKSDIKAAVRVRKVARSATQLQLVSDLCDCVIVVSILDLCSLSDGLVGLVGTCSSLIGLRAAWQKTT